MESTAGQDLNAEEAEAEAGASDILDDSDDDDQLSLFEDLLDGEGQAVDHEEAATATEAKMFRQRLHEVGMEQFVEETLGKRTVSVVKLLTAFGSKIPVWLHADGQSEIAMRALGLAMLRELSKRHRLPQYSTIDHAAELINKSNNIVLITGAGISTSLGIPDFRSKTGGFYTKLQEQGFDDPEHVFEINTFDEDPSLFYNLAGEILPVLNKWTPTHQFIRMIQDKRKLLRNYTQNIDNLEAHAGVLPDKLIQCHGSFARATCRKCGHNVPGEQIFDSIRAKKVARCTKCSKIMASQGLKRKRASPTHDKPKKRRASYDDSEDEGQYDIPEAGVMKPDITFFGEKLPNQFFDMLQNHDRGQVDLVIVIGTSMKVAPVSEIPSFLPPEVPQIYISRDPCHHINFDINLLGDCDRVVQEICKRAGWKLQHEMLSEDEKAYIEADEALEHTYHVTPANPRASLPLPEPRNGAQASVHIDLTEDD